MISYFSITKEICLMSHVLKGNRRAYEKKNLVVLKKNVFFLLGSCPCDNILSLRQLLVEVGTL